MPPATRKRHVPSAARKAAEEDAAVARPRPTKAIAKTRATTTARAAQQQRRTSPSEVQGPEPQDQDQGHGGVDVEIINLYNAAKASADPMQVEAALRAANAKTELRDIIVSANGALRAKLGDKKTPAALRKLAEQLGAETALVTAAAKIKSKNKKMQALQDIIIVQWELERTDVAKMQPRDDDETEQGNEVLDDETGSDHDDDAEPAQAQSGALNHMSTAELFDKAADMGIAESAIEKAMALTTDVQRRQTLVDLILEPDTATGGTLTDEQSAAIGKLTAMGLSRLRRRLDIPTSDWADAVAQAQCMEAMRALIIVSMQGMQQDEIGEALGAVGITSGKQHEVDAASGDADVPRQVVQALVAAAKQEVMKAKGSVTGREGHIASAKMLKIVMETGGGLPPPREQAPSLNSFDQGKFRAALAASDRQTWTQMLADHPDLVKDVLKQAQGNSETINELIQGAGNQTAQGASLSAWISREPVGEPASDWEGVAPRVKSAKLPKKYRNVFLPLQFDRERDYSVSELIDDIDDESKASRYDTEKAKELKSEEAYKKLRKEHKFQTLSDFRDATDRLEHYCGHTQPPILPPMSEELELHRVYVRNLINEMRTAGADKDAKVMKFYVLYDEEVRIRRATNTGHTAWTDDFDKTRRNFLTIPLKQHDRKEREKSDKELKHLRDEITGLKAKKARLQETTDKSGDKKANKNADKKTAAAWDKVKDLPGAKKQHLVKNGKQVCFHHCKLDEGCKFIDSCRFAHHCLKCGGDHPMQQCGK